MGEDEDGDCSLSVRAQLQLQVNAQGLVDVGHEACGDQSEPTSRSGADMLLTLTVFELFH